MMRGLFFALMIFILPLQSVSADVEGVLNSLLAPGPLIGGHKDLEKTGCFQCHDAGKGISQAKCLECHKAVKAFVDKKQGFHGLTTKSCTECHSDHKGRDFNSIAVNTQTFDHLKMTGYALIGKHAEIKCVDCHREKRVGKFLDPQGTRYLGAKASSCTVCHKKDDVHFFTGKFAKQDCSACHTLKSWKTDVKFDHNKETHFQLEEAHAKLNCASCHLVDKVKKVYKYQWPNLKTAQCVACHKDFHGQNVNMAKAGDCLKCHTQTHWKIEKFDHASTGYPLKGKHAELKCSECHKNPVAENDKAFVWKGLKSTCTTCHQDVHKYGGYKSATLGNLNQCQKCHDESSWKKIHDFTHSLKDTRYAIDGKHLDLKCGDCHFAKDKKTGAVPAVGVYHWGKLDSKTCEICHASPHVGEFKGALAEEKCTACHVTEGWKIRPNGAKFDHAKSRFPLDGAHTAISCNACHLVNGKKIYKFKSVDQKFCIDCHKDIHGKQFSSNVNSKSCSECHNTSTFGAPLKFDHATTDYPLLGKHAALQCSDCHKETDKKFELKPPNVKVATEAPMHKFLFPELGKQQCSTCHEDFHKGQLGNDCRKCHTVDSWKKLAFDHSLTKFPLTDRHAGLDCIKCHQASKTEFTMLKGVKTPMMKFAKVSTACVDCHKDPHKNAFGQSCVDCHTAKGWKVVRDFHKNFNLSGVHLQLNCNDCHHEGRKLTGTSPMCFTCHQKDDVHHGTLPNCKDCHTQMFWEQSRFKHSLTRFPLRGVHRTLDCNACHFRGGSSNAYQGLSDLCESCHLRDAMQATSFNHVSSGNLSNCTECHHNQFSFATH